MQDNRRESRTRRIKVLLDRREWAPRRELDAHRREHRVNGKKSRCSQGSLWMVIDAMSGVNWSTMSGNTNHEEEVALHCAVTVKLTETEAKKICVGDARCRSPVVQDGVAPASWTTSIVRSASAEHDGEEDDAAAEAAVDQNLNDYQLSINL